MRILALDTATPLCGVAVYDSETGAAAVRQEAVTTHSDRLLLLVAACLAEQGLRPGDLGAVACGAGPGSFTGLRIGAATAKGLCFALRLPLLMVPSLEVVAVHHRGKAPAVLACLDAWRGQVYAQLFVEGQAAPAPLGVAAAWEPAALREALLPLAGQLAVCGDGARRHPELCPPGSRRVDEDPAPHPLTLARLARERLARGERADLARAAPDYVCPSAAELGLAQARAR